jgi:hypothetical protein
MVTLTRDAATNVGRFTFGSVHAPALGDPATGTFDVRRGNSPTDYIARFTDTTAVSTVLWGTTTTNVRPTAHNQTSLGLDNVRYNALFASELYTQALVARETIATVGGRFLVGPTTVLMADLSTSATTINVKHNNLKNGDRVYLEGFGKIEWLAITSEYSGTASPFTYTVTRNLDTSGANSWIAGDAVFTTGLVGDGHIDLYSDRSAKSRHSYGAEVLSSKPVFYHRVVRTNVFPTGDLGSGNWPLIDADEGTGHCGWVGGGTPIGGGLSAGLFVNTANECRVQFSTGGTTFTGDATFEAWIYQPAAQNASTFL